MGLFKILILFFRKFFEVSRGSLQFSIFYNRMDVEKSQMPFTVFGIVSVLKMNIFRLKIRFSQAQHTIRIFFQILKTGVFSMRLLSNLFSSKSPLQIFLETKRYASMKDSSGFSALCDLPETFIKKCFESKYIFLNFSLFERFAVEKDVFFAVGENGFPVLCASLRVFFGAVKWMKFLCPFTFGSPYDTACLVFSSKGRNFLRKCL